MLREWRHAAMGFGLAFGDCLVLLLWTLGFITALTLVINGWRGVDVTDADRDD